MDICLIRSNTWAQILPTSIHGMLWLQTHFENDQWIALAEESVKIPTIDADLLAKDAKDAGLILNSVPALINSKKF